MAVAAEGGGGAAEGGGGGGGRWWRWRRRVVVVVGSGSGPGIVSRASWCRRKRSRKKSKRILGDNTCSGSGGDLWVGRKRRSTRRLR